METQNDAKAGIPHSARIVQLWYDPAFAEQPPLPSTLAYRPAVLVEFIIHFRSLRAGINDSQERIYTSWLPDGSLPVDWDTPAVEDPQANQLVDRPHADIAGAEAALTIPAERFDEIEADLIDLLVRRERLVVFHNPLFNLFSEVGESRPDFLARTAETALQEIEPELKQLKHVFETQVEQVRQAQLRQDGGGFEDDRTSASDEKADIERRLLCRTEFFEAESHLASLFSGFAGLVLKMPSIQHREQEPVSVAAAELHEDLSRIEQEAAEALNQLYTRYIEMVRSCDEFEIGIQPGNVRVLRRALLWVPVVEG